MLDLLEVIEQDRANTFEAQINKITEELQHNYNKDVDELKSKILSLQDEILDSWIFSGNQNTISDVFVAGSHLIKQSRHAQQTRINADFRTAMQQLKATF